MKFENIILMKYGYHANEDIEEIIKRKTTEIEKMDYCFWGYGGVLLHPINQVQPFCQDKKVYLLLTKTKSKFASISKRAKYYSIDNINYELIPQDINVYGSKYALVFKNLKKVDFSLNLCDYEIGIGKSKTKNLQEYFKYRVDKACAVYKPNLKLAKNVQIDYIAELVEPYAVFIKEDL